MSDEDKIKKLRDIFSDAVGDMKATDPALLNRALNAIAADHYTPVPWANQKPTIEDTVKAGAGSGLACYYFDPDTGSVDVILTKSTDGSGRCQIIGGHMDMARKESPPQAALREMNEELIDESGPILPHIGEGRLVPLDHKLIYTGAGPRFVQSFALRLTRDEMDRVRALQARYNDPAQASALTRLTNNEVAGIAIVGLDDMNANADSLLRYTDQKSLFTKLAARIQCGPACGQRKPGPV